MSYSPMSTYIYSIERIDPQAKPFPSEPDSIVQSNELSESSRVSVLTWAVGRKTPFVDVLFHTFTLPKYFPKNTPTFSKLGAKFYNRYSPQKFSPYFTTINTSAHSDSNFLPSKIRPLTSLHITKNLPVSPSSSAKSLSGVTKVFA